MIFPAPAARAAITQARPRWPAPRTTIVSPSARSGVVVAQRTPAASGLKRTATLAGIESGILCRTVFGCRYMYSE